jgi:SAM-dependent methyltransferase
MNRLLRGVVEATREVFHLPEPVLEVGSLQVDGEDMINLRDIFRGKDFLGVDFRPGKGVDQVADVERLPFADNTFGTVLALSTFEHVKRFWLGFSEVARVLKPGGAFLVSCPFHFHIHAYPSDYWRFTPEALESLLEEHYSEGIIGWHGADRRMANVWALAYKKGGPTRICPRTEGLYREALYDCAQEPMPLGRKVRYGLAALVAGRRPFAPWFDREKIDIRRANLAA